VSAVVGDSGIASLVARGAGGSVAIVEEVNDATE
jgi:hypothetical protein